MYLRVNQPFGLVYDHYLRPRTYVLGHAKNKLQEHNPTFGWVVRAILTSTTRRVVRYYLRPRTYVLGHTQRNTHNTAQPLRVELCNAQFPYGNCATFKIKHWGLDVATSTSTQQHATSHQHNYAHNCCNAVLVASHRRLASFTRVSIADLRLSSAGSHQCTRTYHQHTSIHTNAPELIISTHLSTPMHPN